MDLIISIGLALLVSLVIGSLFNRFGIPTILGYIIGGMIFSPLKELEYLKEIGLVSLLFFIGLDLKEHKMREIKTKYLFIFPIKMIMIITIFYFLGMFLGFTEKESLVLALGMSISSTAIIYSIITKRREINKTEAELSLSFLVIEDFVSILFISLLMIKNISTEFILTIIAFVFISFILMKDASRILSEYIKKLKHEQYLIIYSIAILILLAYASHSLGLSYGIGAFFAGLILGETIYSKKIYQSFIPFRELSLALFFIYLGTHFQIQIETIGYALLLIPIAFIIFFYSYGILGRVVGLKDPNYLVLLSLPIGEFSLLFSYYINSSFLQSLFFFYILISVIITKLTLPRREILNKILDKLHIHPIELPKTIKKTKKKKHLYSIREILIYSLILIALYVLHYYTESLLSKIVIYITTLIPIYYITKEFYLIFKELSPIFRKLNILSFIYLITSLIILLIAILYKTLSILAFFLFLISSVLFVNELRRISKKINQKTNLPESS